MPAPTSGAWLAVPLLAFALVLASRLTMSPRADDARPRGRRRAGRVDRAKGRPGALSRGRIRGRRHDHDDHAIGGPADTRKYRVLSKGNENTVVMTTEPASERGQIMLMKGHDLWIFLPVRFAAGAAPARRSA